MFIKYYNSRKEDFKKEKVFSEKQLEHQLKDAGVETIVILENFAPVLEKILDQVLEKEMNF